MEKYDPSNVICTINGKEITPFVEVPEKRIWHATDANGTVHAICTQGRFFSFTPSDELRIELENTQPSEESPFKLNFKQP